jgi:hypothetical protein
MRALTSSTWQNLFRPIPAASSDTYSKTRQLDIPQLGLVVLSQAEQFRTTRSLLFTKQLTFTQARKARKARKATTATQADFTKTVLYGCTVVTPVTLVTVHSSQDFGYKLEFACLLCRGFS